MIYRIVGFNRDKNINPPNPIFFESETDWEEWMNKDTRWVYLNVKQEAEKLSEKCDWVELQKMVVQDNQLSHKVIAVCGY